MSLFCYDERMKSFAAVLVGLLFLGSIPGPLGAETLSELLSKLEVLKSELSRLQGATSVVFPRDLYVGISGEDVRTLQQILNKDPRTRVASPGLPGGPGSETTYFGSQTKKSVTTFQEIYRSEVLLPGKLYWGNGYVGAFTRKKLEILAKDSPLIVSPVSPKPASSPSVPQSTTAPLGQTSLSPGDTTGTLDPSSSPSSNSSGYFTFPIVGMTEEAILQFVSSYPAPQGEVLAASTGISQPFGGKILQRVDCENGTWISVGPPRAGTFMFVPGVGTLYEYRSLTVGAWVLGLADGVPTACRIEGPNIPAQGTIMIVGTSR